jgi:hypothetical protein
MWDGILDAAGVDVRIHVWVRVVERQPTRDDDRRRRRVGVRRRGDAPLDERRRALRGGERAGRRTTP